MTLRHYSGPTPRRAPGTAGAALVWLAALAVAALTLTFLLVPASSRLGLAVVTVAVFFTASVLHALVYRGLAWALLMVVVTVGVGWVAELVGVRTGVPFGDYAYGGDLGATVVGVPVVVPLAWSMMTYPAWVAARALTGPRWAVALLGGWLLMAWDVLLDPMMVGLGAWSWATPTPSLPGVDGVPLTNLAGWLLVGTVLTALVDALPRRQAPRGQPAFLLLWSYTASVLATALLVDPPAAAAWGGVAMGVVMVPYAWRLFEDRG